MHPATIHGVGVITKLYFAILRDLSQRSFKVIHFGGKRKPVYDLGR